MPARIATLERRVAAERGGRRALVAPAVLAGGVVVLGAIGAGLLGRAYADFHALPDHCLPGCDPAPVKIAVGVGWGLVGAAGVLALVDVGLWVRYARARRGR